MHGVLVDLRNDDEGYIPMEVDYHPGRPSPDYDVIKKHPELASQSLDTARKRGKRLAGRLRLEYIDHHV